MWRTQNRPISFNLLFIHSFVIYQCLSLILFIISLFDGWIIPMMSVHLLPTICIKWAIYEVRFWFICRSIIVSRWLPPKPTCCAITHLFICLHNSYWVYLLYRCNRLFRKKWKFLHCCSYFCAQDHTTECFEYECAIVDMVKQKYQNWLTNETNDMKTRKTVCRFWSINKRSNTPHKIAWCLQANGSGHYIKTRLMGIFSSTTCELVRM